MTNEEHARLTAALVEKHWPYRDSFPPGEDEYLGWFTSVVATNVADTVLVLEGVCTIEQYEDVWFERLHDELAWSDEREGIRGPGLTVHR